MECELSGPTSATHRQQIEVALRGLYAQVDQLVQVSQDAHFALFGSRPGSGTSEAKTDPASFAEEICDLVSEMRDRTAYAAGLVADIQREYRNREPGCVG